MPEFNSSPAANSDRQRHVFSVSELNNAAKYLLENQFPAVWLEGEISNLVQPRSGHIYLTLKDDNAQLRCAMFRGNNLHLNFKPRDGAQVLVRGRLSLFTPRGDYQLIIDQMEQAGLGALQRAFEQLKAKLQAEGLFDDARKRPVPLRPGRIGVITSPTGAAIHDILSVLQRRFPLTEIIVYPTLVQGNEAPAQICAAIAKANARQECDVLIVGRGGGSLEDLWSFNDEKVARAIAASDLPIVSAVGHQIDFTIADFVADLRAPTPTAAAELVAEPRAVWLGALDLLRDRLQDAQQAYVDRQSQRLDLVAGRLGRPSGLVARQRLALSSQSQRLRYAVSHALVQRRRDLQQLEQAWPQAVQRSLQGQRQRLDRAGLRLQLLDPSLVLQRGYAWLSDAQGRTITRAAQTHAGQALQATLADGKVDLTVSPRKEN